MQIPLSGLGELPPAGAMYTIVKNDNPALVQAEVVADVLRLSFAPARQGSATILLRALGADGESSFSITVTAIERGRP